MNGLTNPILVTAGRDAVFLLVWSCQATVLLALVWLLMKVRPAKTPTLRHRIWLLAITAVAVLPLLTTLMQRFPSLQPRPSIVNYAIALPRVIPDAAQPLITETLTANKPTTSPPRATVNRTRVSSIIYRSLFAIWLSGLLINLIRLFKIQIRMQRVLKHARKVVPTDLDVEAIGVRFRLSPEIQSPTLYGLFRPTILLPADIINWTTPAERQAMVQHELAHIERWDALVNFFQTTVQLVFFFHPLVCYACRQLSLEREMACDDSVVRRGVIAEVYAESILKVAERTLARSHVHQLALFSAKQTLERRLDMILTNNRMRATTRQWRYMIAPGVLIAIAAWLLVPTGPARSSLAQSPASKASPNREIVQRLGEDKAFDELIEMALRNPDAELRGLAVTQLTELEGDGSTGAMVELYEKTSEPSVKRVLIETLGRISEIEPLTKIALLDRSAEYRHLALVQIKRLKETSDSGDIKAWDVSSLQDQLNKLKAQP
jgi:beta-lactamase regulating signal transducer with metallopeptidase domain